MLRQLLARLADWVPDLGDIVTFGGLAGACYGIAQIYPPAAWIVGGG